jgi:HPt (histidine-containing phosphotransfer) domain-containing protein
MTDQKLTPASTGWSAGDSRLPARHGRRESGNRTGVFLRDGIDASPAPSPLPARPAIAREVSVFDPVSALHRAGGDTELLREVIALFRDEAPTWLAEIRADLDRQDVPAIERAAHRFNGAAGSLGAQNVCDEALRLELSARAADLAEVAESFGRLTLEMERLRPALEAFGVEESA